VTTELADAEESGHAQNGEEVLAVALYCPECAEGEFRWPDRSSFEGRAAVERHGASSARPLSNLRQLSRRR
jgi:hypothetical protein